MKNLYKNKKELLNNVRVALLVLITLFFFDSLKAQNNLTVDFMGKGSVFGDPGAYIKSLYYDGNFKDEGMVFYADKKKVMTMYSDVVYMHKPMFLDDHLLFNAKLGTIGGIGLLVGSDAGLRLNGAMVNNFDDPVIADIFINKAGLVGIGRNNALPNGALHVYGADNNGPTATLTIESPSQRMLIDGNEIDANTGLYLQGNSDTNIRMAEGGGKVGVGLNPLERLHITGNLRLDNGLFITNKEMIFRPAVADVGDVNTNNIIFQNNAEIEIMRINKDGNVGIGTATPTQKLEVEGTVKASSFVSSASSFPDYVFESDYNLLSLNQLHSFIKENKHLPNMPSEKEVVENGLDVTDVVVKSVENIENIYLHLIQLNEKMEALEKENAELKALLNY